MYFYIIYFQMFIHTSVNIIFKNHYMIIVKYMYDLLTSHDKILSSEIWGVPAHLSKCWRVTWSEKGWEPLCWPISEASIRFFTSLPATYGRNFQRNRFPHDCLVFPCLPNEEPEKKREACVERCSFWHWPGKAAGPINFILHWLSPQKGRFFKQVVLNISYAS